MNEYEIIPNPKIKHMHCFVNKITYRNFHIHNNFEILLVLKGDGIVNVSNRTYYVKKDDIMLINPNEPHEISGGVICCILQISRQFCGLYYQSLKNTLFDKEHVNSFASQEDIDILKRQIKDVTFNYVERKEYFEIVCVKQILELLYMLLQVVSHTIMSTSEYNNYSKKIARLNRISAYIDAHYQEPIRLEMIAMEEQVTVTYLSHLFRDCFGITFQEYLNNKRFEQAMRLIAREDLNLTQISEFSGFSDLKYLNKIFQKRMGVSPKQFRGGKQRVTNLEQNVSKAILEYKYSIEESMALLKDCE